MYKRQSVGEGMIQYCSSNVTAEEEEAFRKIMAPAGRLDAVPENQMCIRDSCTSWQKGSSMRVELV